MATKRPPLDCALDAARPERLGACRWAQAPGPAGQPCRCPRSDPPLAPALFEYGVDVISGTRVVEPLLALRCVAEGAVFRQLRGVRLLTMQRGAENW